ncbi:unnamed protein product, partial [marine sediment metagenome]
MSAEYTQAQLERMVNGTPHIPNVIFYEKAVLDRDASERESRRVYTKVVFIKITQPGLTDWAAYKAQPEDFRKFAEEYDYFLNNKQGTREPGIEIIPELDIAHLQELIDMGIATIPKLAAALQVPPHLEYAQQAAVTINNVLEETKHAQEKAQSKAQDREKTRLVPPADRQKHPTDVGQSGLSPGDSSGENEDAKRFHAGGQDNHRQNPVDNWRV